MLCAYYKELINFENPESKKFICTQTRANCGCSGNVDNCDFYRPKDAEKKETGFIYYAHHQWKYDTKIEAYELALIERYFPYAPIFNPSVDLKTKGCGDEEKIMAECLETVERSGFVIFSSMDGMVGKGVYEEVAYAKETGKMVLYMHRNTLHSDFKIVRTPEYNSDRLYGYVAYATLDD
jgi:hypothetical protein|nr:MAG TPA: protein of unknown function (DUF4406) [Caudoviricetes sp.]